MFLLSKNKLLFLILLFLGEKVSFGMFLFQNSLFKGCKLSLQKITQDVPKTCNELEGPNGTFFSFERLPQELRIHTITFLDPLTVKSCSNTCNFLNKNIPLRCFILNVWSLESISEKQVFNFLIASELFWQMGEITYEEKLSLQKILIISNPERIKIREDIYAYEEYDEYYLKNYSQIRNWQYCKREVLFYNQERQTFVPCLKSAVSKGLYGAEPEYVEYCFMPSLMLATYLNDEKLIRSIISSSEEQLLKDNKSPLMSDINLCTSISLKEKKLNSLHPLLQIYRKALKIPRYKIYARCCWSATSDADILQSILSYFPECINMYMKPVEVPRTITDATAKQCAEGNEEIAAVIKKFGGKKSEDLNPLDHAYNLGVIVVHNMSPDILNSLITHVAKTYTIDYQG